jgi:two-component system KDP operon response regulator KdpE
MGPDPQTQPRGATPDAPAIVDPCALACGDRGIDRGASDELLARIRAAQRRAGTDPGTGIITAGPVRIDLAARTTERDGATVHLTPKEWGVMAALVRNPGKLVSPGELLIQVWGPRYAGESEYLRSVMLRLRRKLEAQPSAPRYVTTEPGVGYRSTP